ncbi:MAG: S1 family peptidase [Phycisphaerales bacterium]|jgi:S1-C subfamily serine protease
MNAPRLVVALVAMLSVVGTVHALPEAAPKAAGDVATIVAEKSPAIVSIKFILKGGEQDEEVETTGFVIDPAGLILSNNNAFGGLAARFGGPTPTPTDIKVLIGEDTQGVDAKFMARDSELGLAWVQLSEAPAKPLAFVDLTKSSEGKTGEAIVQVSLMGKFFDRVPMVSTGEIASVVKKPRELYIPSIGLAAGEMGLPVFNAAGSLLGVTTLILPDQEEIMGSAGGMRSAMRGITGGMILPAKEVLAATARAKETKPEAEAPAAPAAAEEKPAAEPATEK